MDEAGHETWVPGNSSNQTRIQYAPGNPQSEISFQLNELLCKPPGPWISHWTEAKGENCYGPRGTSPAHGATDLEHPPSSSCGTMTVEACQQKCLDTEGCTAVTVAPQATGEVACYRKADVNLEHCDSGTTFTTYVRSQWLLAGGFNCYDGHGAKDLEHPASADCGIMDVHSCQQKCNNTPNCTGVTWQGSDHSGIGKCYRKADIHISKCDRGTGFDTYLAQ